MIKEWKTLGDWLNAIPDQLLIAKPTIPDEGTNEELRIGPRKLSPCLKVPSFFLFHF